MDSLRKPSWLTKRISFNGPVQEVRTLMRKQSLHTVCESARCPNIGERWSRRTATFENILRVPRYAHCASHAAAALPELGIAHEKQED